MENKKQILIIHGGMTFSTHEGYIDYLKTRKISLDEKIRWSDKYFNRELEDTYQIIRPDMPLKDNAKYDEWKIHFERYIELVNNDVILIGKSLGGIFLAKYLSENKASKKIKSVYLIAPPYDNSLDGEELVGGFELGDNLSMIFENCKDVTLMFSRDDDCVTLAHAEKYKAKLPKANFVVYESKGGHFKVEEFPEIVEMIKGK